MSNEVNRDDIVVTNLVSLLKENGLLVNNSKVEWVGTMTDLLDELKYTCTKSEKGFLPNSPSSLRSVLNRVINRIRCRGLSVKFTRGTDYNRTRLVSFVG